MVKSISELKMVLQNMALQALKMPQDEIYKVFQKHITEFYSEKVFSNATSAVILIYMMMQFIN